MDYTLQRFQRPRSSMILIFLSSRKPKCSQEKYTAHMPSMTSSRPTYSWIGVELIATELRLQLKQELALTNLTSKEGGYSTLGVFGRLWPKRFHHQTHFYKVRVPIAPSEALRSVTRYDKIG